MIPNVLAQAYTVEQLHDDVRLSLRRFPVVGDFDKTRMSDEIYSAGLVEESIGDLLIPRKLGVENLDCHSTRYFLVDALEYSPHPSFPNLSKDLVGPYLGADGEHNSLHYTRCVGRLIRSICSLSSDGHVYSLAAG